MKNTSSDTLTMDLASDFDAIEQVVEQTGAFLAEQGVDDDLAYRVVLLASEAVTNAVEHGNGFDASKRVQMSLVVGPTRIELCVEDEGGGFDPDRVADPLQDENLTADRGRGIYLIEQMADGFQYERDGRRVRLFFNRTAAA